MASDITLNLKLEPGSVLHLLDDIDISLAQPSKVKRTCKYCRTIQTNHICTQCGAPEQAELSQVNYMQLRTQPYITPCLHDAVAFFH